APCWRRAPLRSMSDVECISVGAVSQRQRNVRPSEPAAPAQLSLLLSPCGFSAAVPASEFLDASGGIDELLLAGEKGMTSGTNTDPNIATCGAGMIHRAARADDIRLVILWMNACFHLRKGARNLLGHVVSCKR